MKNKLLPALLIIVTGLAAFLLYQDIRLKKQLKDALASAELKVAPVIETTKPANPPGVSPFDKPNVDPKADEFKPSIDTTSIQFEHMSYDFGRIKQGDVVHTQFKFINTGPWALIIGGAQGSCGCTVPQWPKEPIKPGESGVIDVSFDSKGKLGENKKTVTVVSNTKPVIHTLIITSTVVIPE